jgi:hypothetical protein
MSLSLSTWQSSKAHVCLLFFHGIIEKSSYIILTLARTTRWSLSYRFSKAHVRLLFFHVKKKPKKTLSYPNSKAEPFIKVQQSSCLSSVLSWSNNKKYGYYPNPCRFNKVEPFILVQQSSCQSFVLS